MVEILSAGVCEGRTRVTTISSCQQCTARWNIMVPPIYHAPTVDDTKPVPLGSIDRVYGSEHPRQQGWQSPQMFLENKKTQKALICPQPKVLGPLMKKRQRQKSLRRHIVGRPKSTVIFSPGDHSCLFDGSTLLDSLITLAKKKQTNARASVRIRFRNSMYCTSHSIWHTRTEEIYSKAIHRQRHCQHQTQEATQNNEKLEPTKLWKALRYVCSAN